MSVLPKDQATAIGSHEVIEIDPRQYAVPYPDPMESNDDVVTLRDFILKLSDESIASTMAVLTSTIDETVPHSNAWLEWRTRPFLGVESLHNCLSEIPKAIMRHWRHERHLGQGLDAWFYAYLISWLDREDETLIDRVVTQKTEFDSMDKPQFIKYVGNNDSNLRLQIAAKSLPARIWKPDINTIYLNMMRYDDASC